MSQTRTAIFKSNTDIHSGFAQSLKMWEKCDTLFKALGSVKVCEFWGLQSAREKLSAYQSETAFPKTER